MSYGILNRNTVFFLIVLCSVHFFTIIIFPRQAMAAIEALGGFLLIFLVIVYTFYNRDSRPPVRKNFIIGHLLLIFGVLISIPMASIFQGQSFMITFFASKFTFYLLLYNMLHYFKIDYKNLRNFIIVLGVIWVAIFIIQYVIFPRLILSSRVEMERGTIRIFFPGGLFATIAYFILLQETLTKRIRLRNLAYLLSYFATVGILQGTRQSLVVLVIFTGLFILLNKDIKSKVLIFFISALMAIGLFFYFYDIFMGMLEVTETQMGKHEDPIRIKSARFFTGEFMQHPLTYIFGNGADHGSSGYGLRIIYYKFTYGFFQSDIGIIGHYSKFGVLYVLGQLILLFKILLGKMPKSLTYMRYIVGITLMTIFTGGSVFGGSDGIAAMMIMMYLIDYEKNQLQHETS